MKIILTYDLAPDSEAFLIEWIQERIDDKSPNNLSPLRYVEDMEIQK